MRINKIQVQNLKAVAEAGIDLHGKSVIVTGGNDKGKSTILAALIDRFRGERPEIILKEGEKNGFYFMELTDGSRIEWKFTGKTETFNYITKDGIKQTSAVLTGIGERYFGRKFDIDKFLNSTPKEQMATLQKLVGLDFSEIDTRYNKVFNDRRLLNAELTILRGQKKKEPEPVEPVNLDEYIQAINEAKQENERRRKEWKQKNEAHIEAIKQENERIKEQKIAWEETLWAWELLKKILDNPLAAAVDYKKAEQIVKDTPTGGELKEIKMLPEPEYIDTTLLEQQLEKAREQEVKYKEYLKEKEEYDKWIVDGKRVKAKIEELNQKLKAINEERKQMIEQADIPAEFSFNDDGLLYNGLPLSTKQLSSSAKYIAALKLGAMVIGEVKALHFDAGLLDKQNLNKVIEWADENDLQLLIERPDFDGGDIKYEFVKSE